MKQVLCVGWGFQIVRQHISVAYITQTVVVSALLWQLWQENGKTDVWKSEEQRMTAQQVSLFLG